MASISANSSRVLFQKQDAKVENWATHLAGRGVGAEGVNGSPMIAPIVLLREILHGQPYTAYVFRYLNDYPSLGRTIARFITEVFVIVLCRLSGTRVFWLLHNVDKESQQYWPLITATRRKVIAKTAGRGFVTDPLLVPRAKHLFPRLDWDAMPFGVSDTRQAVCGENDLVRRAASALACQMENEGLESPIIGLCATALSRKYRHLDCFDQMLKKFPWMGLVFVVDFSSANDDYFSDVKNLIVSHPRCTLIDRNIDVDELLVKGSFQFVYRSLSDCSLPFTVYRSARALLPLVTHRVGFVAEIVEEYEIGAIVEDKSEQEMKGFLTGWDPASWDGFLATRSWEAGAESLLKGLSR